VPGQLRSQRKQKSHEQNSGAGHPQFQVPGRGVDLWGFPDQNQTDFGFGLLANMQASYWQIR